MIMSGLVTIVVPVYNAVDFLGRCLDSILSQSYTNLEVICIDDASCDTSAEIILMYAQKDERVKPFFNEVNRGAGAARNEGIRRATGSYVAFVDADDILPVRSIELRLNVLKKYGSEAVRGGIMRLYKNGESVKTTPCTGVIPNVCPAEDMHSLFRSALDGHTLFLFTIESVRRHSLWNEEAVRNNEDLIFLMNMFFSLKKLTFFDEIVYIYDRSHGETLSSNPLNKEKNFAVMYALDYFYKLCRVYDKIHYADSHFFLLMQWFFSEAREAARVNVLDMEAYVHFLSSFQEIEQRYCVLDRFFNQGSSLITEEYIPPSFIVLLLILKSGYIHSARQFSSILIYNYSNLPSVSLYEPCFFKALLAGDKWKALYEADECIRTSLSWRITYPLRKGKRFFKDFFKKMCK